MPTASVSFKKNNIFTCKTSKKNKPVGPEIINIPLKCSRLSILHPNLRHLYTQIKTFLSHGMKKMSREKIKQTKSTSCVVSGKFCPLCFSGTWKIFLIFKTTSKYILLKIMGSKGKGRNLPLEFMTSILTIVTNRVCSDQILGATKNLIEMWRQLRKSKQIHIQ